MDFLERVTELKQKEQEIKLKIDKLTNGLEHDKWNFHLHLHPTIAPGFSAKIFAWTGTLPYRQGACFSIKYRHVELVSCGDFPDSWQDAEAIINNWLKQRF